VAKRSLVYNHLYNQSGRKYTNSFNYTAYTYAETSKYVQAVVVHKVE